MSYTTPLIGFDAFKVFVNTLRPKDGSREIWFKAGHNKFFVGNWDESGHFPLYSTKGEGKARCRIASVPDAFDYLDKYSKRFDGGVFCIYSQPLGSPLAECVETLDDIGIERDHGTTDEQNASFKAFTQISGIDFNTKLSSGGKSVHAHIKLDQHYPAETVIYLRRLAAIALLADPIPTRLHQPMRVPGFHRREKGQDQVLLESTGAQYSLAAFITGMQSFFSYKGWQFPERITEDWWRGFQRCLAGRIEERVKADQVEALLFEGLEGFEARITAEAVARDEAAALRSARIHETGKTDLVSVIGEAEDLLGSKPFDWNGHQWKWANDKARGCCPWHESSTGTAGWIAPKKSGAGWGYACGACTSDRQISAFTYRWYLQNGLNAPYPTGKQFVDAAREFLSFAGVELPDLVDTFETREPDSTAYAAYIKAEQLQDEIEVAKHRESVFSNFKKHIAKLTRTVKQPKPFVPRKEDKAVDFEYEPGGRLATWRSLSTRYKFILDQSETGSGKSFDTGNAEPEDFGASKLFYWTDQVRNPTNETLSDTKGWKGVEGRHGGLKVDDRGKIRVAKLGDTPDTPGNCSRIDVISALRYKNISGADTDVVCTTCPLQKACKHFTGDGYGFKYQRRETLPHDRVRIHPSSSPDVSSFDFSESVCIVDEPGVNLQTTRTIEIGDRDIEQLTALLALENPDLFNQVRPILIALSQLMRKKSRFGFNLTEIKKSLPDVSNIDRDALWLALVPDLSVLEEPDEVMVPDLDIEGLRKAYQRDRAELGKQQALELAVFFLSKEDKERIKAKYKERKASLRQAFDCQVRELKAKHREEMRSLNKTLRRLTAQSSRDAADRVSESVVKQWLPELLDIVQHGTGNAHVNYQDLTLTLPDARQINVLQASKAVIFLDATLSRADTAAKLRINPTEIVVIRQRKEETPNLKLIQVDDIGRLGMQRGKQQERRVNALVQHIKQNDPTAKAIDFKKFDADGVWFRDSRGVNDFLDCKTLVLVGTPCTNLNVLLSEYACDTGISDIEDEGFKAYVDRKIRSDIHQAIGRLRANRRLGDQLKVILLTDFDLQLPNVERVKASSITEEAADKFERFKLAVTRAMSQLKEQGEKVTQSAVSAITSYSQQYISRNWDLLLLLLDNLYSKSSKNPPPPPDLEEEEIVQVSSLILEQVTVDLTPSELAESLNDVFFEMIPEPLWKTLISRLSDRAKFSVLECLAGILPTEFLLGEEPQ